MCFSATELLVYGLKELPDASQLRMSAESTTLLWALEQPALQADIARTWVSQWTIGMVAYLSL